MSVFISIIVFLVVLGVLVVVHEFGHYIIAKKSGIRVDEFGFGFPPRIKTLFVYKGTRFTWNLIPFGGFVKIFGENSIQKTDPNFKQSFVAKRKLTQIAVLFAGPLFNFLFAWILLSSLFVFGSPAILTSENKDVLTNPQVSVIEIIPNSPASQSGFLIGDVIRSVVFDGVEFSVSEPDSLSQIFMDTGTQEVVVVVERGKGRVLKKNVVPEYGLFDGQSSPALGFSVAQVGTLQLPIHKALMQGGLRTWEITKSTFTFIYSLIENIFTSEKENLGSVTGPIGIVPIVGDALKIGFSFIVVLTALISVNLAVINLLPFPALDGGRILFVIIEKIIGQPIGVKTTQIVNGVGFLILLILMFVITIRDIINLL